MLAGVCRAQTAPQAPALPRHKIQVSDPALAGALTAGGARLIADYGAFQLYDADQAAVDALAGQAQVRDNYNSVLLNAARLDTSLPEIQSLRKTVGAFVGRRMHLVQFAGPVQPAWREDLLKAGARIVSYIPQNAYLVYGDSNAIAQIQSLAANAPHFQWEGVYRDEYKIHPAAQSVDAKGNPRQIGAEWFAIQMVADAGANADTLRLLDGLKLEALRSPHFALNYLNVVGRFRPADLPRIAAQPDVVSILPYVTPKKMDERQDQIVAGNISGNTPSGPGYLAWLEGLGFTQAQFDASGFAVDVSDSGIDDGTTSPNHFGLYTDGIAGGDSHVIYNRLEGTPNPRSTLKGCDGHGNLNAHIIGGYDNGASFPFEDSSGYHYGLGTCPFVRLGSSVVFDPDYWTDPDYPTLQTAAYKSGARISNNSWGGSTGVYDSDAQEFDALVRDADTSTAGNQEMVMVFAAGNDMNGPEADSVTSPGTAKNVITVGAAQGVQAIGGSDICGWPDSDADDANFVPGFSGEGPCNDGRHKPDIMAPGTHISGGVIQAANPGTDGTADLCFIDFPSSELGVCGGTDGDLFFPAGQQFYTTSTGTSHSTPCVSGGCALLRQYFINYGWSPPSPAMTKAFLMNSARYLTGGGANDTLWSDSQGMGEMDLGMAFDGTLRILEDELAGDLFTATGQKRTFAGTIADTTKPFRVTLAWTDAPGSTTASLALNNDLDLTVTIGGVTYFGNNFSGEYSVAGGSPDTLDNVESVYLPAGVSGPFTITVTAASINSVGVPNGADALEQDFALVAYNATPVSITSPILVAETCAPTNGVIDPGETVIVDFALQNGGAVNLTNLLVTLLQTNGVFLPDGAKTVSVLAAGGPPILVPFAFTAVGSCGGTLTATLALQGDAGSLGTITNTFPLGLFIQTLALTQNFDSVTAPALPAGWSTDVTGEVGAWFTESTNGTVDSPPNAAFCADSPNSGVSELLSPVFAIAGASAQLEFRQSYALEADSAASVAFDGGVLEIKIGAGSFTDILAAGGTFLQNGYNMTSDEEADDPGNQFPGRAVWSGVSGPYSTNSYITTIVQLPPAAAGQSVQLKWRLGTDDNNEYRPFVGWWVDSIVVNDGYYSCCSGAPVTQPELLYPTNGFRCAWDTFPVIGEAVPGLLLTVYDNGASNTASLVPSYGSFSADVSLAFGTNVLTAVQSLSGTNVSSAPLTVLLPPPPPALSAPSVSAQVVAYTESGLSNAVVALYDGVAPSGVLLATFTNNSSGNFSGTVTLSDGLHSLTAIETFAGLTSFSSAPAPVEVTTVPPPTILSPVSGQIVTNPSLTLRGKGIAAAKVSIYDDGGLLTNVTVKSAGAFSTILKLGGGAHSLTAIQTQNGMASPPSPAVVVMVILAPVISVEPQDQTNFLKGSVTFVSGATGAPPLRYYWERDGVKIPGATGASLTLRSLTASSAATYHMVASNSYGSASSGDATLTLVPNPFPNLTGNYAGLFLETNALETNAQFRSSGLFTLSLTSLGAYTGKILNAGGACSFSGSFPCTGRVAQTVSRGKDLTPLTLDLTLDLTRGTEQILGYVSNATWIASLQADRATYSAPARAPESSNHYTLIFACDSGGANSPGGDGFGKVTVSSAGKISLTGTLSDNTAVAPAAVSVSKYGQWPLYIPLYGKEGSLSGWVDFTNAPGLSFQGNGAGWFRTNSSGKFYPRGFTNYLSIIGSTFAPAAAHEPALALTNLVVTLDGAGLSLPLTNNVTLSPNGKFLTVLTNNPDISKLTLSVVPGTGLISGSFSNPATHLSSAVKGVVFQQQTNAAGFFLGTNMTGSFLLTLPGTNMTGPSLLTLP
ncbi:MAG: S8 family serine peptidase [Verrucomicrobiota bacterium]